MLAYLLYRGIERGRGKGRGRESGRERMQDSMSNSSIVSSLLELVRLFCYYCISFGDYILCMSRNPAFSTYDVKVRFVNIKHIFFLISMTTLKEKSLWYLIHTAQILKVLENKVNKMIATHLQQNLNVPDACEAVSVLYVSPFVGQSDFSLCACACVWLWGAALGHGSCYVRDGTCIL